MAEYVPFLISADSLALVNGGLHPRSTDKTITTGCRTQKLGFAQHRIGTSYVVHRWVLPLMSSAAEKVTPVFQSLIGILKMIIRSKEFRL
jgi:hypothetical protein